MPLPTWGENYTDVGKISWKLYSFIPLGNLERKKASFLYYSTQKLLYTVMPQLTWMKTYSVVGKL